MRLRLSPKRLVDLIVDGLFAKLSIFHVLYASYFRAGGHADELAVAGYRLL
jgi:hypothetical protein